MGRSRRKYGKVKAEGKAPSCDVEIDDTCSGITRVPRSEDHDPDMDKTANMLMTPGTKEKAEKVKLKIEPTVKKLSKKQRKKLQKVVDQKQKKSKRAELLEQLSKVQVEPSELALMGSIAHLGTKNSSLQLSKRPLPDDVKKEVEKLNSVRGSKRRKKQAKTPVVEESSESEDTSDISLTSEDEEKKKDDNDFNIQKSPMIDQDEKASGTPTPPEAQEDNDKNPTSSNLPPHPAFPSVYVPLERGVEVQEARLKLPILAEEQAIMEAIRHNQVVILCGETGSGKTTQVPQFLYEAGYANEGIIGVTEPRRVAAISMSERVAMEMNLPQSKVSYQIRYEGNATSSTQIKFMTDGVLLREVQEDFLLSRYSCVIVDEAHERSVYTDVLIGLLSRIVPLRNKREKPLRLVIMSATLRVEDFTENLKLFKKTPPVIKVETRQFPVTVHFNKTTPIDDGNGGRAYVKAAYKKVCKIHRTLPTGGILVFVTGQNEVHSLCRMLRSAFPNKMKVREDKKRAANSSVDERSKAGLVKKEEDEVSEETSKLPDFDLKNYSTLPGEKMEEKNILDELEDRDAPAGLSDDEDLGSEDGMDDEEFSQEIDQNLPMHVLPLYSLLAPSKQRNVFKPPPEGFRLVIIATNVAETSLTIPGIKYIVDTGKVKKRFYDKVTGISSFQVTWVSKASADQRAGRAGRLGPGHAYRLYSSAVFQDFKQFSVPEIASRPVPGLVLQMKQLNIERVVNFPFPTPPPEESLKAAEELLISLGAVEAPKAKRLSDASKVRFSGRITLLGRTMAEFPVHPRFAKMLAAACAKDHTDLLPYIITIVAALTVREIFVESQELALSEDDKEKQRQASARLGHLKTVWGGDSNENARDLGDLMVLLGAVGSAEYTGLTPQFCSWNCLRFKALLEVRKLRSQLINIVNSSKSDSQLCLDAKMGPPTNSQIRLIRQIVLSALGDHVARKIPESQIKNSDDPQRVRRLTGAYSCLLTTEPVFIHPTSIMAQSGSLPEFLVFQEIIETKKSYMKGVFTIDVDWLARLCPQHCSFSQPLEEPSPFLDEKSGCVCCHVNATYGRLSWPLGSVEMEYPAGLDRYKWFARFMLEKYVVRKLPRQFSLLMSRPEIMTKAWSNLQPRTQVLLQELFREEVDCKDKLVAAWKKDPAYLLAAFRQWLPESVRNDVDPYWPPKL